MSRRVGARPGFAKVLRSVRSLPDQYQLRSADALDQSIIIRRCGDSSRIFTDDFRIALNGIAHDYVPAAT